MRQLNWRYINDSNAYYVHSVLGDDNTGDGTRAKPFRTITYALNYIPKRKIINCIGVFSEQVIIVDETLKIRGDHKGAMTFDGKNELLLSGMSIDNMILKNIPIDIDNPRLGIGTTTYVNSALIEHALGANGENNIIHNCPLFGGHIIGSSSSRYNVISSPQCSDSFKICFSSPNKIPSANTIYDIPLIKRKQNIRSTTSTIQRWIFAKCAMIANDSIMQYTECLFTSDTIWYLDVSGTDIITYADMDAVIAAGNAENRGEAIRYIMQNTYNITNTKNLPTFIDCIFTDLTSEQIFNDPENVDFTLKYFEDNPAILSQQKYIGALPPALKLSIKANSDGQTFCFDNRTLDGCLTIDANNILNINTSSASDTGHIYSKIIIINPVELQFSGIYALTQNHFTTQKAVMNINKPWTQQYSESDSLPLGKYIVVGGYVSYNSVTYGDGYVFNVESANTQYSIADGSPSVYYLEEPNLTNVVYVRTQSAIFRKLLANEQLQSGGYYINISDNATMIYDGRTIQPRESFIADGALTFTAADNQVGILFDDTRVPAAEWIPSDAWGDYFVWRENGAIKKDSYGVPISSGNSLSYVNSSSGGYSNVLIKSIIKEHFVQFGIFVNKI